MPTLQLTIIAAALSAALGFGSAWRIQSLRADKKEKAHAESLLAQEKEARHFDNARLTAAAAAQAAGTVRAVRLRADAVAAGDAFTRLRGASDAALRAASANLDACLNTAAAEGELFLASAGRYRELAETADRHANDVETLIQACPK